MPSKQIKDLEKYILVQVDRDVIDSFEYMGIKPDNEGSYPYSYLFIKLDKSGADYLEVYGSNNCNLETHAELLWRNHKILI